MVADFGEPIYPGLRRLGSLRAGGDKPAHVVVKGENRHVLEALHARRQGRLHLHPSTRRTRTDTPKWLAFMGRLLRLAKQFLNPEDSDLHQELGHAEQIRVEVEADSHLRACLCGSRLEVLMAEGGDQIVERQIEIGCHHLNRVASPHQFRQTFSWDAVHCG